MSISELLKSGTCDPLTPQDIANMALSEYREAKRAAKRGDIESVVAHYNEHVALIDAMEQK